MTACWLLLFYALWHRIHIEGKPHDGDIMDTLKAA
jgi:asparagine synthase (glutamine-hydrolysing)